VSSQSFVGGNGQFQCFRCPQLFHHQSKQGSNNDSRACQPLTSCRADEPPQQVLVINLLLILCQLEQPKATQIRKLQRKIVPFLLRATIPAACHTTPLAGRTGVCKMHWQTLAAQFWWPEMSRNVAKQCSNAPIVECQLSKSPSTTSVMSSVDG
jgi:hypothetical protein